MKEVEKVSTHENLPTQTIFNSSIQFTDSAKLTFQISGGKIDRYTGDEPRDEFSDGVKVISYNRNGTIESIIISRKAINYPKELRMEASDSVVLESSEGKKLETEMLIWDQEANRIFTDKNVTITTPTEILWGQGLEASDDFSSYEIRNMTGQIKLKDQAADSTKS
jgi:LPS export ABC transporter protein LptC